jgi:glycosyltransferase involved in cell wall biosynthesis
MEINMALFTNYPRNTGVGGYAYELWRSLKDFGSAHLLDCSEKEGSNIKGIRFPLLSKTLNAHFIYPKKIRATDGYSVYHLTNQFLANTICKEKPFVITCHDLIMIKEKSSPWLTRYLQNNALPKMRDARWIIANSEYTKEEIKKTFGLPGENITTIYYGLDHGLFRPLNKTVCRKKLGLPAGKTILLTVGSPEPRKNFARVIEAFVAVKKSLDNSVILKVGDIMPENRHLINKMGIEKDIIHMKTVKKQDMGLIYGASDVLVFPSFYEGFGLPPLEAMACGIPVVTSDCTSLPEVAGKAGLIVDPHDPEDIAINTLKALDDNSRKKITRAGLQQAKKFTWQRAARETMDVYKKIVR